jgi:hypothetical protein
MTRKSILFALASLAVASVTLAQGNMTQDGCPYAPDRNDVVARPLAVQTYAEAYNRPAPGSFLLGTSDPTPPVTISSPNCSAPGDTTIGRAGYVGSFEGAPDPTNDNGAEYPDNDGNDMVAVFVFDARQVVGSARHYGMRFQNIQNFVGNAFVLSVKLLDNRGENLDQPGGRGVFNRTPVANPAPPAPPSTNFTPTGAMGPFGAPLAGVISTVYADTRHDRGDEHVGSCAIPARGTLAIHDSGPDAAPYQTFDRDADIALAPGEEDSPYRNIRDRIRAAQNSTESYPACRYSCITAAGALQRNMTHRTK